PWWGDVIAENPKTVARLRQRIREEGPIRSIEMEGRGSQGWWDLKLAKRVAAALWSSGELAIRERRNFQRSFDLTERVIPKEYLEQSVSKEQAFDTLLLRALKGHGWATTGTLAKTWRLTNCGAEIKASLARLCEAEKVMSCVLEEPGKPSSGWITPKDIQMTDRLLAARPRRDKGVLLSPFDPVLWDRQRVSKLFGFEQILEIFKPASQRVFGYYCLPVLAGDRLVARVDLKADSRKRELNVLSLHTETQRRTRDLSRSAVAVNRALDRYSQSLGYQLQGDLPT
ncbi:MAG: DNA glycosylase AlkZ-like family protein, partial [Gammaproteobacteria bacterium]